jgi:hypothetical protein
MPSKRSRDLLAFALALVIAAFVLFYRLTDFPSYFFCDEAIPAVEVQSLLATGRDRAGVSWPLFIRGYGAYQLSLSVYWLLPFQALFGMSEIVVRACAALASLIGVAGASFFVRRIFPANRCWTLVPLVFYGAPFWYLHTRTGFEVVISASAWLIVVASFGSLWRTGPTDSRSVRREIATWACFLLAFAFCFYSYTPARGWAPVTLVVLLLAWLPVTLVQWRRTTLLLLLTTLLVTPYLMAALFRPEIAFGRLNDLGGMHLDQALPQLGTVVDPHYWFSSDVRFQSRERHTLPGLGLIPFYFLPFMLLGALVCLIEFRRRPEARAVILLLPVGAFPAVLVALNPLRSMPVGLVYLLLTAAGLAFLGQWLATSWRQTRIAVGALLAINLLALNHYVFAFAIRSYSDYGFYGVQTGQREVFAWIKANLDRYGEIRLTHAAFNGNETLIDFYLTGAEREAVKVRNAKAPCVLDEARTQVWILREERHVRLEHSACPVVRQILQTLYDPRGAPLFRMVQISPLPEFIAPDEPRR